MMHNEHLRRADESYEIRHDSKGNAIHIYIYGGSAIIFRTLNDLIQYVYMGVSNIERMYAIESDLEFIYECDSYLFDDIKSIYDFSILHILRTLAQEDILESEKTHAWAHLIKTDIAYKINNYYRGMAQHYISSGIIDDKGNII